MNSLLGFYKGAGKLLQADLAKKGSNLLAGMHPPHYQTPGKMQYYRSENTPFIPDEVKWAVRAPSKYAMSEMKMSYLPQIEEEVTKFMHESIKVNYLRPAEELTLDLSVSEAEILASANPTV